MINFCLSRGHNHVMDVLVELARNTGYSVRVNHKVSTTAAASNKQGNVKLMNFGLDGSNNLVINVSICCNHICKSTFNNGHLNSKMHTNDYLQAHAGAKNRKYKEDYAAVGTAFAPAIVSVAGQIYLEFFRLLWALADKQTRYYYAQLLRSWAQRRRLAARHSRGVEHARLVLTRTLSARPSLMPLPHAYTSPCTVQLRSRVVNLASPFHRLNASCAALNMHRTAPHLACSALHMHCTTPPLTLHPLAPLSTWTLVHPASRHLLMLIMQVPLER